MKAFELNRFIFELYSVCDTKTPNKWPVRFGRKLFFLILLSIIIVSITSSAIYVHKFLETDLIGTFFAVFQIAAGVTITSTMISGYINRRKFGEIFTKFQPIQSNLKTEKKFIFFASSHNNYSFEQPKSTHLISSKKLIEKLESLRLEPYAFSPLSMDPQQHYKVLQAMPIAIWTIDWMIRCVCIDRFPMCKVLFKACVDFSKRQLHLVKQIKFSFP